MNLLAPFGKLYGLVMDLRNLLYDRGVFKSYALGARTISVGNLTTGGTGKTPLVALIAKILIESGEKVCILTRGYGRKNPKSRVLVSDGEGFLVDVETGGDEPVELALKLDGKAVIIADPDRVAAAKWSRDKFPITAFILDDGFQHRRARRDLDIVCIDATDPCGNGRILPAGTLRESFKGLKRADAIVITRTDQVGEVEALEARLSNRNRDAPVFKARTELRGLVSIEEFHAKAQRPQSEAPNGLFAFAAIGKPKNFFACLKAANLEILAVESFPDHHNFSQAEIAMVEEKARKAGAAGLVTTAKDAVKLGKMNFVLPCYVAVANLVIDDIERFRRLVISSS